MEDEILTLFNKVDSLKDNNICSMIQNKNFNNDYWKTNTK